MNSLIPIKTVIQKTTRGISLAGMFLLIPLMLLTSVEVVSRGLWSMPIPGTFELSSYMLSIFVLLGVAYTHQVRGHVRVTMVTRMLPAKLCVCLDMVTTCLSIFIIAILAWQGWVHGMETTTVSDMLRIPQRPFKLLVAVAGLLLVLELIIDLLESFAKLVKIS